MTLRSDLRRLIPRDHSTRRLGPAPERSAIPSGQSVGRSASPLDGARPSGGGISWPLVEDTDGRAYYPPVDMLTSSDGLFVLEGEPIKILSLTDGDGNSGQLQLKNTYA